MSDPKEKYFLIDFPEGATTERETLPQIFKLIDEWLKSNEETEYQIESKDIVLIKGTRIELEIETIKKVIQK